MPRSLRFGSREYPLLLPTLRDPRLHLAATIVSLQVLGQTVLRFELSIAQILVSLGTCAVLELGLTFWDRGVIAWPASALLTGNGVALILRVNGTEHGDWWSLEGWHFFAATAALAVLSKWLIRVDGRPLFNPSNFGLVLCFLIVGTERVNPLDFWWGPMSPGLAAAIVVIAVGGLAVTRRLGLLEVSLAFWATFAAGLAVITLAGHCMSARWHVGPVCGWSFWWTLVTSPEVLVFLLFMITDPRTIPRGRRARLAYATGVGLVAVALIAPSQTEFWSKVALLGALVLVCATRPLLERWLPDPAADAVSPRWPARAVPALGFAVLAAAGLVLAGIPAREPQASAAGPAADPAVAEARPPVDLAADAVPPVEVSEDAARYGPDLDAADAATLGRHLVEDLVIEADALAAGDATALAAAVTGPRLAAAEARLGTTPAMPHPDLERLTVVLVREEGNFQAVPRLAVHAVGRDGTGAPLDRVFVMAPAGGVHLIAEDLAPG